MKILTISFAVLLLFSCKKEENTNNNSSNFTLPSTIGSYWVYECNNRDTDGNITPMGITDTVRIIGDTVIGGENFVSYEGTIYGAPKSKWFLRDSSGYIIDENGNIKYSTVNFTDTLESYVEGIDFKIDWFMSSNTNTIVNVPAGNFSTLDYQGHCRKLNGQNFFGCGTQTYVVHNYFAPNIGLIKGSTIFFGQLETTCNDIERVLKEYHIE
jgi:hypothetical protein